MDYDFVSHYYYFNEVNDEYFHLLSHLYLMLIHMIVNYPLVIVIHDFLDYLDYLNHLLEYRNQLINEILVRIILRRIISTNTTSTASCWSM